MRTMNRRAKKVPIKRLRIALVSTLALIMVAGCLCGCGGKKALSHSRVTFTVTPEPGINDAQPFYVVIREVNKKSFLMENYDKIADSVYADPPDKSLLGSQVILPGKTEVIKVAIPSESDIGIYALFTRPGENWKIMITKPLGSKYDIVVQNTGMEHAKGGFWAWLKGLF